MDRLPPERLEALLSDLRAELGEAAVDTSDAAAFAYGRDLWPTLTLEVRDRRGPLARPDAVLRPRDEATALLGLRIAARHGVGIVPFGSGSGVCGGAAPIHGGVVIDLKGLNQLDEPDPVALAVTCGPGIITQDLEQRLNDRGFTLGHFPSSIFCASIGGCVAARGAGQLSSRYGKIEDMVTGLRVATPGLGILSTGSLDSSGLSPDWTPMFVGSEGTLGLITRIRLRIRPLPAAMVLRGVRFPDLETGIRCFRTILQSGLRPSAMRIYDPLDTWMAMQKSGDSDGVVPRPGGGSPMDGHSAPAEPSPDVLGQPEEISRWLSALGPLKSLRQNRGGRGLRERIGTFLKPENLPIHRVLGNPGRLNRAISLLPERCLGILGCEGEPAAAQEHLDAALGICLAMGAEDLGAGPGERWFRSRHHVSFKLPKLLAQGSFADTMEVAAPWTRVQQLYTTVRAALSPHVLVMAHLSHAYHEGCSIYFTMVGHAKSPEQAGRIYRAAWDAALEATLACNATITHHHGVGVLKKEFMNREHRAARQLYEATRQAVDPGRNLNLGKLFPSSLPAPEPAAAAPPALLLEVESDEDGTARVGVDWNGADLVAQLTERGYFLPPLGRDFLEGTVGEWLQSPAVPAHHCVHGAWEHPLVAVSGQLPDSQLWRSGQLPRSAAGPSYLPFGVGTDLLPTQVRSATFRIHMGQRLQHFGHRFADLDTAEQALSSALRDSPRPLAGILFAADEPGAFRNMSPSPGRKSTEAFVFLTLGAIDGCAAATDRIAEKLAEGGGQPTPEDHVLGWWQDHWGKACRGGSEVLASTGNRVDGTVVGSCAAVVPWGKAGLLLRAIETLTGGAHRATGWLEAPLETGCTLRVVFTASRKDAGGSALLLHQLKATLRSYGARIARLHFEGGEEAPDYLIGGRGTPDLEGSDALRLAHAVGSNLRAQFAPGGT
jgi:alkyldihydroxyacetonephosphate synthase